MGFHEICGISLSIVSSHLFLIFLENVEELIERQEKSLTQLETKRLPVKDLIEKGKKLLENPE